MRPAQRDRRPCRRLRALSRARGRGRQPEQAASPRSDRYRARGRRSGRTRNGPIRSRIVALDPYGHVVGEAFAKQLADGWDIRPTIAVTRARLTVPELKPCGPPGADRGGWARGHRDRRGELHQGGDRAGVVAAGGGRALRRVRDRSPPPSVRADRRHVPGAGHALRSQGVPAADRRPDRLPVRRCRRARRSCAQGRVPRARRMQRLGRVRLGHLHLPAVSGARHRGVHRDRPGGRRRHHRVQPQGGQGARRGDQVPGLQRAQAAAGRRSGVGLLRAHRVRRRRAGRTLPGADAGRAPLAGRDGGSTASCR